VAEQLCNVSLSPRAILSEPEGRNTAAAILAAALTAEREAGDGMLLVLPCDHVVPDVAAFHAALARGMPAAEAGRIVTFGVTPSHGETGYGYLELAEAPQSAQAAVPLANFIEKPDATRAAALAASGKHLWNSGIFLFSTSSILRAFRQTAPEMVAPVAKAVKNAADDLCFRRLDPEPWRHVEEISIDYAVMEKAQNLSVVPFDARWSDVGDWASVLRESMSDAECVATFGRATAIDCHDTILRSEDDGLEVVGLGLKDIIAVAMPDAVLVASADKSQDVKSVVAAVREKGATQATTFPKDHRPWGWFESLAIGDRFQVKRIHVHPGGALSLQSHNHRAEHWVVVEGTAQVTLDGEVSLMTENQSIYIPCGSVHRLENPGKRTVVLIEVQTGGYLGEDDITRYEDAYARD